MSGEVKNFLHSWCGKQKMTPNYEVRAVGSKIRPRFMCEVGVKHLAYVYHSRFACSTDDDIV